MVENLPTFYTLLFLSGIFYPLFSSVCGFLWCFGRILYAIGYSIHADKRVYGAPFYAIGTLGLLGSLIYVSYQTIVLGF
jgi:glutathione S-transferase